MRGKKRARRNPRGRKKISVRNCFRQNPKTFLTAPPRLPTRCTHTNPTRPSHLAFPFPSLRRTIPFLPSALPLRSDPPSPSLSPLGGGQIRWAWPMGRARTVASFFGSPRQARGGRRRPPRCASTRTPPVVDRELGVAGLDVQRQEDQGHQGVPEDGRGLCPALGHDRDGVPCGVVGWEVMCVEDCQTPSSPTQRPSRRGWWPASILGSFPGAPSPGRSARLGSRAIPSTRDTESTSSGGGRGTRQWR
jgi:hypothetical protein